MASTIRYPYHKRPRPEFAEVPLDVEDREAGTILVRLADLPREKFAYLEKTLSSAKRNFYRVTAEQRAATLAATGRLEGSSESEIFRALAVVQDLKEIKPAVKRLLKHTLEDLAKKTGEAKGTTEETFVAQLRATSIGHPFAQRVLAFAEALLEGQAVNAQQQIEEAFSSPMAEAVRALRTARRELIRHAVTDHKDLFGEVTLDDGGALLGEDGKPTVEPIPFVGSAWSWGGKKRAGCSEETLDLYDGISDRGGCLYSLSEAVLLWNNGTVPTPDLIWDSWSKKAEVVKEEAAPEKEAPASRDGDAPQDNVVPFDAGA